MTDHRHLDELLRAQDGDAGCTAGEDILDAYVDLELAGEDPARVFPGTAIHTPARRAHRSSTRSSCGREQQMSALPTAGGSTGSGS
jgi:hypothetical protein